MHAILRLAVLGFLIAGSLANNGPSGSGPNAASVLSVRIWQAARFAVSQLGEGHELMWIRRYEWSQNQAGINYNLWLTIMKMMNHQVDCEATVLQHYNGTMVLQRTNC